MNPAIPPADPLHFVTTLDAGYVPGLLALLQSLRENAGLPFRFSVVTYGRQRLESAAA